MCKRPEEGRANQGKRRASRRIAQVRQAPKQNETKKAIRPEDVNEFMEAVSISDNTIVTRRWLERRLPRSCRDDKKFAQTIYKARLDCERVHNPAARLDSRGANFFSSLRVFSSRY